MSALLPGLCPITKRKRWTASKAGFDYVGNMEVHHGLFSDVVIQTWGEKKDKEQKRDTDSLPALCGLDAADSDDDSDDDNPFGWDTVIAEEQAEKRINDQEHLPVPSGPPRAQAPAAAPPVDKHNVPFTSMTEEENAANKKSATSLAKMNPLWLLVIIKVLLDTILFFYTQIVCCLRCASPTSAVWMIRP